MRVNSQVTSNVATRRLLSTPLCPPTSVWHGVGPCPKQFPGMFWRQHFSGTIPNRRLHTAALFWGLKESQAEGQKHQGSCFELLFLQPGGLKHPNPSQDIMLDVPSEVPRQLSNTDCSSPGYMWSKQIISALEECKWPQSALHNIQAYTWAVSMEQLICSNSFLGKAVTHAAASALWNVQPFHAKLQRQRGWGWRYGGMRWDYAGMVLLFWLEKSR